MENKQVVNFDDIWLIKRSFLYAEIEGAQVACTHLSTPIPPVPYSGVHGDVQGQNAYEMDEMIAFMDERDNGSP